MALPNALHATGSRLMSREEATNYVGLASRSLTRLVERGVLTPVVIPGMRRVLFDRCDLDALIQAAKEAQP